MPAMSVIEMTRRLPSRKRAACTIRSTAETTWWRMAVSGISPVPIITRYSRRWMVSRGLLAWTVNIDPGWPVFIACSASMASGPRTSPTMMRSGRIRSAFFSRSRMWISPAPSAEGARVSRRTTCGCCRLSSAASSSVTTRSSTPMFSESAFKSVVLPEPVPPETTMLSCALVASSSSVAMPGCMAPVRASSAMENPPARKRRMEMAAPSMASGGPMMFTREPSGRRASHMGLSSSTCRPTPSAMRWAMRVKWLASRKATSTLLSRPWRSTYTEFRPLTRMSEMSGSRSSGPRGPRPRISSTSRVASRLWAPPMAGASGAASSWRMSESTSSPMPSSSSTDACSASMASRIRPWYQGTASSKRLRDGCGVAKRVPTWTPVRGRRPSRLWRMDCTMLLSWTVAPVACSEWVAGQFRKRRLRRTVKMERNVDAS